MNIVELVALAAIWGASFLFMKIATPALGPVPLIAVRVAIAALVLLPVLRTADYRRHFKRNVLPLFVVGVTNSAIPFSLLAFSTLYLNAGFDSILNATTPLWAALFGVLWLEVTMGRNQVLGLFLGLVGVIVLVSNNLSVGSAGAPLAIAAALLATCFYGFSVHYSKRRLAGVPAFLIAFGSQFFAALVLLPLALCFWPKTSVQPSTWLAVVGLGVICTGLAFVLYFRLIERVGAAYAASVTFLIPVFGLVWGALFLDEKVTGTTLLGCVIVLLGTALASGKLAVLPTSKRSS